MKKSACLLLLLMTVLSVVACMDAKQTSDPTDPDPTITVNELLRLHGLLGKQPEGRSHKTKNTEIDMASLEPLFVNLEKHDPFLRDVYVGFVVGALARYQGKLFVSKHENEANVRAGNLTVRMKLENDCYKIDLEKTVPTVIKQRAAEERARYAQSPTGAKRP
jgi:hypothetical protein